MFIMLLTSFISVVYAMNNEVDLPNGSEKSLEPKTVKQKPNQHAEKAVEIRAGHARALQSLADEKYQEFDYKNLVLKVEKLTDSQGLSYLAGRVPDAEVGQYLKQMQLILADDYQTFRQQQSARDHGEFHITLINPYEYQALTDKTSVLNQPIRVKLHGLGRVSQGNKTTYYVVASSDDGQFLRQKLLLPEKDFHVTLGFNPQDVYGVSKGLETLIK